MEHSNQPPPQDTLPAATDPESNDNKTQHSFHLSSLGTLNRQQAITFAAAFLGWTLDAFDYFIVVLAIPYIAKEFQMEPSVITGSITITLCFRPIGAAIFGLLADRYGRRYPLMADIILYSTMELASGFAPNFKAFIILRAIFGIAMGGEWGLGAALAMEILPPESRGLFSGILQQGYATGYLLAAVLYYVVIDRIGWRAMFWIGSFPALLVIVLRFFVPESPAWHAQQKNASNDWWGNTKSVLKLHWKRFIYCVLLMACFNFLSHGTQDLYPTFLKNQLGYSSTQITILTVVANIGAIIGGSLCGYFSQMFGRKIIIVAAAVLAACFVPLYILPRSFGLLVFGAFSLYFCVQGSWGVVPAHLNELSPKEFRGTFPGLTYQLGNLISSSSAQIEAKLGERFRTNGVPNYGLVIAVLTIIVVFLLVVLTLIGILFGKENRNLNFTEQNRKENRQFRQSDENSANEKQNENNEDEKEGKVTLDIST